MYNFKPKNTCSYNIKFDIKDGKVCYLEFSGGCKGNSQGLSAMCIGSTPEETISRLKGIQCRGGTSCPDQLATALEKYLSEN